MSPLYYNLLRSNNDNSALLPALLPQPRPSRFDSERSTPAALAKNSGASVRAANPHGIVRRRAKAGTNAQAPRPKGAGRKGCGSGSRGRTRLPDRTQREVHEGTEINQEKQISPAEAREEGQAKRALIPAWRVPIRDMGTNRQVDGKHFGVSRERSVRLGRFRVLA